MGHSENRGRRGLTLPLQPRAKLIGLSILIAGFASLITSAQLDPIMAQVERVIDGDTIRVRFEEKELHRPTHGSGHPSGDEAPHQGGRILWPRGKRLHQGRARRWPDRCYSQRTAPEIP